MTKLVDLVTAFDLAVRCGRQGLVNEVTGGYASDLLSDVMANSCEGDVWITLQIHHNIVTVASMKDLAGVILACGREPDEDTLEKAEAENLPLLVSKLPTFELAGRLYAMGIRGAGG